MIKISSTPAAGLGSETFQRRRPLLGRTGDIRHKLQADGAARGRSCYSDKAAVPRTCGKRPCCSAFSRLPPAARLDRGRRSLPMMPRTGNRGTGPVAILGCTVVLRRRPPAQFQARFPNFDNAPLLPTLKPDLWRRPDRNRFTRRMPRAFPIAAPARLAGLQRHCSHTISPAFRTCEKRIDSCRYGSATPLKNDRKPVTPDRPRTASAAQDEWRMMTTHYDPRISPLFEYRQDDAWLQQLSASGER